MGSEQYSNDLLSAMSIIANRAVETAGYDKTIKATIVQCQDATIEKYKVQYQDGYWTAYGNGSGVSYPKGTAVYILIPNGNISQRKTILGSVKQLGINYVNISPQENKYEENGNNVLTKQSTSYGLCSYKTETQIIYDSDKDSSITVNVKAANSYIKKSSHLKCSFNVRTELPIDQRYNGNYGIKFYLNFKDRTMNETTTRVYVFDSYLMEGNPFLFKNTVYQTAAFEIDGVNFEKISKIELFTERFPNQDNDKPDDIFITNLDIKGVSLLPQQEMDKVSLSFVAKNGYIFESNTDQSTKKIEAVVRVLGKTITDVAEQDLKFYWFVQNISITQTSVYYNKYGGFGWRCLNSYKTLAKDTNGNITRIEFNPGKSSFTVNKEDVKIKEQKYKCVVLYGGSSFEKEFTIENEDAVYDISITSDKGTKFTLDSGYPTLTCNVSSKNDTKNLIYRWGFINYQGNFFQLPSDKTNYNAWEADVKKYNDTKNNLENTIDNAEDALKAEDELNNLKSKIKKWDKTEIVYGSHIYHVNIKEIINFSTFICTVIHHDSNNKVYNVIGSAQITLVNESSSKGGYILHINNGKQIFNYNEEGLSPCKNPKIKYVIPQLSFSLYSPQGQEIDQDQIEPKNILWSVPSADSTLLTFKEKGIESGNRRLYYDRKTLAYGILNKYIKNKNINNIQLQVKYHGYTLTAETDFVFTRQGFTGTNGTGIYLRIVPLDNNQIQVNDLPYSKNGTLNFKFLKAQLYKGGEQITSDFTCVWSSLINKNVIFNKNTAKIVSITSSIKSYEIIKLAVTISGKMIYATLPILYYYTTPNYNIYLKQNTGYQYVYYAQDGSSPQYDNKYPFTFIVEQKSGNKWYDISKLKKFIETNPFQYFTQGNLTTKNSDEYTSSNTVKISPSSYYDGSNINNLVKCVVSITGKKEKEIVASCEVPIHMMLNRYGHAALNDWDGNSIDIGSNGETILAPQVGAGRKKSGENGFTGIVIGSVKTTTKDKNIIQDGLFGYSNGARTIFLNANSGKATFGLKGQGQIEIDGSSATITGGSYSEKDKTGMQIDLKKPSIQYGNGKFSVNKNGALTSTSGEIAGWIINEKKLTKGKVGISSDNSKNTNIAFWAGDTEAEDAPFRVAFNGALTSTSGEIAGWIIGKNSLTKGKVGISSDDAKSNNIAFWAGSSNAKDAPFRVDFDGDLVVNSGKIGKGSNPIYIGGNNSGRLYSGSHNLLKSTSKGFYIGNDGFSFGNYFTMEPTGKLTATSGKIASWNFDSNAIYNDEVVTNGVKKYANDKGTVYTRGIYFGKGGLRMGTNFHVDESGNLYANNGYFQGQLYSSKGKIANWKIESTLLSGGKMQINSNGSMKGSNWSIDANGKANFSNMNISGGTISGGSRTGGSIKGGSINPSSVACGNYKNMDTWVVNEIHAQKAWITNLVVDNLKAEKLTYQGKKVKWKWKQIFENAYLVPDYTTINNIRVLSNVKLHYRTVGCYIMTT